MSDPAPLPHEEIPDGTGFRALVFDWDGTLVQSRDVNFNAVCAALHDFGITLDPGWYWSRHAYSVPDLLTIWEGQFGSLPADIATITERFREYILESAADLPVNAALARIAGAAAERGQKLAIASNASRPVISAGLTSLGLDALFPVIATRFDVKRGKPAPDVFTLSARLLGVEPRDCLVYEDADEGVVAALTAGMSAYNVTSRVIWLQP